MSDNPYLSLVSPSEPEQDRAPANPYIGLIAEQENARRMQQAGTIVSAAGRDPDQRAQALSLAKETGLPPDTVERNKAAAEREAKIKRLRSVMDDAPALAKLIEEDPEFLTLSQDDSALLRSGVWDKLKKEFVAGIATNQLGFAGSEAMGNGLTPEIKARVDALRGEIGQADQALTDNWFVDKMAAPASRLLGQQVEGIPRRGAAAMVGAGAAALAGPGAPVAMPMAAATGFAAQSAVESGLIEQGSSWLELNDIRGKDGQPLDPNVRDGAAAAVGLINGSLEMIGMGTVAKPAMDAAKKLFAKGVSEYAATEAGETALKAFLKGYGEAVVGETATEVLQEVTNITSEEIAKMASNDEFDRLANSEEERKKAVERVLDIAAQTAGGMALLGLPGAGGSAMSVKIDQKRKQVQQQQGQALAAELNAQNLDAAVETAQQSKLLGRSKERFEAAVDAMTDNADVHIGAEPLQRLFQSLDAERAFALAEELNIDDPFMEAQRTGGDIAIPVGKYLTTLSPYHAQLRNDVRMDPDGSTLSEAQSFNTEKETALRDQADELNREFEAERQAREPAQQVADDVRSQLRATGHYGKDSIDQMAALWSSFFQTQFGPQAWEAYQKYGVKIVGEMPTVLSQRDINEMDFLIDAVRKGKVPKQETGPSLLDFISERGGMEDSGGELAARDLGTWHRGKPGKKRLVRESADRSPSLPGVAPGGRQNSIEEVARAAADAGYLPDLKRQMEDPEAPAPDMINTLLAAIDKELGGTPVYSERDVNPQTEAERRAIEELGILLDRMGIDLNDPATTNEVVKQAIDGLSTDQAGDNALYQNGQINTESEAFKRWFGDSKVVDENGQPLRVYHGSVADIAEFRHMLTGLGADHKTAGFYFTNRTDYSHIGSESGGEGHNVSPVYIKMENPYHTTSQSLIEGVNAWKDNQEFVNDLKANGYDGIIYSKSGDITKGPTGWGDDHPQYVAFSPTQIKSVFNRGTFDPNDPRILYQGGGGSVSAALGSIEFGDKTIITLFRNPNPANLSTFLHESGHLFLRILREVAVAEDAPDRVKSDWKTITTWLGNDGGPMTVEQEEKWARGFEAYLREGKAPSLELQSTFSRFKAWLMSIYTSMKALRVQMTPEIKGVMDRMLASEEEIAAAEKAMKYTSPFKDAKQAGMTEQEFAAYTERAAKAHEQASNSLLSHMLSEERRAREAWWKEERAATRRDVESDVNSRPVYAASLFLTNGEWAMGGEAPMRMKLDRAALVQMHGEQSLKYLPRGKGGSWAYTREGGFHPDMVAPLFGYPSGDAMLKAMWDAPKRNEVIERETDARMTERHGDMLNDGTAEEKALEAVHSDDRGKVLLAELQAMRKASVQAERAQRSEGRYVAREVAASVEADPETYRKIARVMLGRKLVKDATNPVTYQRAEVRAAAASERAIGKEDYLEAGKQKERQILNFYLWSEARKAKSEVEKAQEVFARFAKSDEKLTKTLDLDYIYAIRWVLGRYSIGRADPKWDFFNWMNNLRADDPGTFESIALAVDAASGTARPWKQLSLDEFKGLVDAVDNLRTVGRSVRKIELDGQKVDIETAVGEMAQQAAPFITDRPGGDRGLTDKERRGMELLGALAGARRVESWAREMDGGTAGSFTKYIVRPIMGVVGKYRDAKRDTLTKLLAILEPRRNELMTSGKIDAPEISYTFANKGELLAAILHTGNESNMERLLLAQRRSNPAWGKVLPDGSLDTSRWTAMIDRMAKDGRLTKEDFDTAQAIWDLNESLKPAAQKAHREMYGYYFAEITAQPVKTPFGNYRGGYMPAIVDRDLTIDGEQRNAQDALKEQNTAAMFPSTGRGFTKSRVQNYHQPLDLNLMLVPSHLDKVLRFIHLQPTIRGLGRIAINRSFVSMMDNASPHSIDSMLLPWLNRVARQSVETPPTTTGGRAAARVARYFRNATGLQIMAGNFLNAIQQIAGFAPAMVRVKPAALMRALVEYRSNPETTRQAILDKSAFMRTQIDDSTNELMGNIDEILGEPGVINSMQRFGQKHGYFFQQMFQNVVDVTTWRAAYEQATARGLSDNDAVYEADEIVRATQGSLAPENISNWESGGAVQRLFTQFVSYFNVQANLLLTEGRTALRAGDKSRLFALYMYGVFLPAVLADVIVRTAKGEWDDEDDGMLDDLAETFLLSQMRYVTAMVPMAGPVMTAFLNKYFTGAAFDDRISTTPVASTLERAIDAPAAIYKAIADDGKPSRAIKDTAILIGLWLGLPLGQAARPVGYAADVATGRND